MGTRKWTLLEIAGVGLLAYYALGYLSTAAMNEIEYGSPKISFRNLTLNGVNVEIRLPITNKLPVSIPIDALRGHVAYGQYVLAPFQINQAVTLQAGATTDLVFQSYINTAEFTGNLAALVSSGEFLQSLRLVGMATVKSFNYPFDETVSIGV